MDPDELITVTRAAALLNVSRASIYSAISRGAIRSERLLDKVAVYRADVEAYVPRTYEGKRENRRPAGEKGPGGRPKNTGTR